MFSAHASQQVCCKVKALRGVVTVTVKPPQKNDIAKLI